MKSINLIGLDENFNVVGIVYYTNLQWSRKWNECGSFSVEIPLDKYDKSIVYLYTKDRPEMAKIEQVNYIVKRNQNAVNLSGYFLEHELNKRVVFSKGTSNITSEPNWLYKKAPAEDVAIEYFKAFKDISFTASDGSTVTSTLNITIPASESRGKTAFHHRNNEYLGNKLYSILKASNMSFRIVYDYEADEKKLVILESKDVTSTNTVGNNPIVFSTKYNNVESVDLLLDNSSFKNAYIVENKYTDEEQNEIIYSEAGSERNDDDTEELYVFKSSAIQRSDYETESEYLEALQADGHEELLSHKKIINLEFSAVQGTYEYMTDFDIGYKCSIEIPELSISADAVLIAVYEVIKSGTHKLTLEFGEPLIKE